MEAVLNEIVLFAVAEPGPTAVIVFTTIFIVLTLYLRVKGVLPLPPADGEQLARNQTIGVLITVFVMIPLIALAAIMKF